MLKIESKTGIANGNQETVYNYVSDFRNFSHMLPADRLSNMEVTSDVIRFDISGLGTVGLKIAEKKPYTQLVITGTEDSAADFTFWLNIATISDNRSQVNLTLQANLNMFMEIMAKGPLQQFTNLIIDKLSTMEFNK